MKYRLVAAAFLIAVYAPAPVVAQEASPSSSANWDAVASCAALAGAEARHACVDDVLLRAGVLSPRVVAQTPENFGIETRTIERGSRSVIAPAAVVPLARSAPEINEIATTIASVVEVGYQKLRVTTAEGSVWEQSQAGTFTSFPEVGQAFVIERGAISGFRCSFGRASLYRCERVQ